MSYDERFHDFERTTNKLWDGVIGLHTIAHKLLWGDGMQKQAALQHVVWLCELLEKAADELNLAFNQKRKVDMSDTALHQEEHKKRHIELHKALDELATDYLVQHGGKIPSHTTIMELMTWSNEQQKNPNGGDGGDN